MLFGLSGLDIAVIVIYFAIIIGIGVWASRRVRSQEDYFLAGRRLGKFIQTFTAFGQGTNVESPVGVATTTFTNGAAGIWSSLVYLFVTPFYWLITPWVRRLRVLTMADYFEERYGSKAIAALYTIVASTVMTAHLSVGFNAASKTIMALSPKEIVQLTPAEKIEYEQAMELAKLRKADYETLSGAKKQRLSELSRLGPRKMFSHIDRDLLIWIICIVVMLYGIAGGLEAAALTDALQGMCIILLTVILFPFCWTRINALCGGESVMDALHTVHARLPESFFDILGSPTLMDFTWYYIAALCLLMISNTPPQANFLTCNASARNEFACRFGATWGSYIKRFCAVLWGFFALCALVIYHDKIHDSDLLWGVATHDLLGPAGVGLVGLMIACLMAALMSTADTIMITCSSLLTKNIYRPLFPNYSEKHYVLVGRVLGGIVVIAGAIVATQFDSILQLLKFMWEINVMVAATWWLGMKWRRANRIGAWCSMATAAGLFFLLPILLPLLMPSLHTSEKMLKTTQAIPVVRTYTAHEMDVEARQREIAAWKALPEEQKQTTPAPVALKKGDVFEKSFVLPPKAIFWTKGIKKVEGIDRGAGLLNIELLFLHKIGYNLEGNTYAMNETIRTLIKTILPFLMLIVVSLLTQPEDKERLDRFYVKMRTEVKTGREEDAREVELSYADPQRYSQRKLFPNSNWELLKWNRVDVIGFSLAFACIFAVLGFLKLLVSLGG